MNIADDNTERADAYKILADLYSKAPGQEQLEGIREDLELKSQEDAREIHDDFKNVFHYPGGKLPPVESVFLFQSGSGSVTPVTELYAAAGLIIGEQFIMVPDHVSLEFLFMSYLVTTRNLDLQNKFLQEHLVNWVPFYCEAVKKEAKTLFYREIAGMTSDFIESEYDSFE